MSKPSQIIIDKALVLVKKDNPNMEEWVAKEYLKLHPEDYILTALLDYLDEEAPTQSQQSKKEDV